MILLIEDELRLAELLQRALTEDGFEVHHVINTKKAKAFLEQNTPSLILSDIMLPGRENGLDFCQYVRARNSHIPIIMLTALGTTDHKVEGFDAGADDYLVKPFEMRELLARIRRLIDRRGTKENPSSNTQIADLTLDRKTKKVERAGKELRLTPREFRLLEFLLMNHNRVISREEIAKEVWGVTFDTGTNYIDVYINYLRKKVDKPFDRKLIHTRPGMGFIITDHAPIYSQSVHRSKSPTTTEYNG